MKRIVALTLSLIMGVMASQAIAEPEGSENMPFTGQWAIGGGAGFSTSPYAGMDDDVTPFPLISYHGERLFLQGTSLGVNLFKMKKGPCVLSFAAVGRYEMGGYDSDDSNYLTGMDDRDGAFNAGIRALAKVGRINSRLAFTTDVTGEHDGQQLDFSMGTDFEITDSWSITPSVGAHWLSGNKADYYYGVASHEAIVTRLMYEVDSAINYNVKVATRYRLNQHWMLLGSVGVTLLDDEIQDSPIVDEDHLIDGFAGIQYRF